MTMTVTAKTAIRLALATAATLALWTSCGEPFLPELKSSYGAFDGSRAFAHAKAMVDLGPRPAGSEALLKNVEYIRSELATLNLELQVQEFTSDAPGAKGITFRNLWCDIPGEDPENGPILLLSAHYDTKKTQGHKDTSQNFRFVGAMDGAGPSAILLELARVLAPGKRKPTVRLVWFDGEESIPFVWDSQAQGVTNLIGSEYYANSLSESKQIGRVRVMVLLDLLGSKDIKIDRDRFSNGKLNDLFASTAEEMGEGDRAYRYISEISGDDHLPFIKRGVKAIDLIDFRFRIPNQPLNRMQGDKRKPPAEGDLVAWWHTEQDNLENMDPRALDFSGNLVLNALPKILTKFYK